MSPSTWPCPALTLPSTPAMVRGAGCCVGSILWVALTVPAKGGAPRLDQAQPLTRSLSGVAIQVLPPQPVPPANNPNTLPGSLLAPMLTLAFCPHRNPLHHPAGGI